MWVINKSGFFSIVQHNKNAGVLMIRARVVDDLVRAFPDDIDKIVELESADYRYRISLPREDVEQWMLEELDDVTYTSHAKEEMSEGKPGRHSAYMDVWNILGNLQPGGPYGRARLDTRSTTVVSGRPHFSAGTSVIAIGQTEYDADLVSLDDCIIDVYAVEDELECGVCGEPVMLSIDRNSWEHAFTDEDMGHEATAIVARSVFVDDKWIHEYCDEPPRYAAGIKKTDTNTGMASAISQLKGKLNNE